MNQPIFKLILSIKILTLVFINCPAQPPKSDRRPADSYKLCREHNPEDAVNEVYASDNVNKIIYLFKNKKIEAFDMTDGGILWSNEISYERLSEKKLSNDSIYFIENIENIEKTGNSLNMKVAEDAKNPKNEVNAKNKAKNKVVDSAKISAENSAENGDEGASLVRYENAGVSGNFKRSFIKSVSRETGITLWIQEIPYTAEHELRIITDESLLVKLHKDQYLLLNSRNGQIISKSRSADEYEPDDSAKIYIFSSGNDSKELAAVSNIGKLISVLNFENDVTAALVKSSGQIIIGDKKGSVRSIAAVTNKAQWTAKFGGAITNLTLSEDRKEKRSERSEKSENIIVTSLDNFVYYVNSKNGRLIWKKRLSGRITEAPVINGNTALVSVVGSSSAQFLHLENGMIENQITLTGSNYFIKPVFFKSGEVILQTNLGINFYSQNDC